MQIDARHARWKTLKGGIVGLRDQHAALPKGRLGLVESLLGPRRHRRFAFAELRNVDFEVRLAGVLRKAHVPDAGKVVCVEVRRGRGRLFGGRRLQRVRGGLRGNGAAACGRAGLWPPTAGKTETVDPDRDGRASLAWRCVATFPYP